MHAGSAQHGSVGAHLHRLRCRRLLQGGSQHVLRLQAPPQPAEAQEGAVVPDLDQVHLLTTRLRIPAVQLISRLQA